MTSGEGDNIDTIIICSALTRASAIYPLATVPVALIGAAMLWIILSGPV